MISRRPLRGESPAAISSELVCESLTFRLELIVGEEALGVERLESTKGFTNFGSI